MSEQRKLASIQKIRQIISMPDCDNIELAIVNNWEVIVKKNEYAIGDLVIYLEIDSIIPEILRPELLFMENSKWRVKTKKIRGVYSQGLIINKSLLSDLFNYEELCNDYPLEEGTDLTSLLQIVKYEPPVSIQLRGDNTNKWLSEDLPKTDEERIQNVTECIFELAKNTIPEWAASYKIDGSSFTVALIDNTFRVASHNIELLDSIHNRQDNNFWQIAIKHDLHNKLKLIQEKFNLNNIALQGELCGPSIQSNRQKFESLTVRWFYIFNIDTKRYINHDLFLEIIDFINEKAVSFMKNFNLQDFKNPKELIEYVSNTLNKNEEGLVIYAKNIENLIDININDIITLKRYLSNRISFKVINNKYLI